MATYWILARTDTPEGRIPRFVAIGLINGYTDDIGYAHRFTSENEAVVARVGGVNHPVEEVIFIDEEER